MGSYGGEPADGYRDYSDAIPLLITALPRLQEQERQRARGRAQEPGWGQRRDAWQGQDDEDDEGAPVPAPSGPRCERCGGPRAGEWGLRHELAPDEDGRHCPQCRIDLQLIPTTLRQSLFGRPNK
jgi:hypothetical protein